MNGLGMVTIGVVCAARLAAQEAPTLRLPVSSMRQHPEPFGYVTSVRELRDGRVLLAELRGYRLVVLDFRSGTVQDIGRRGKGPGEYQEINRLHQLPHDSSLAEDRRTARWLVLKGATIAETVQPVWHIRASRAPSVSGADGKGRVLEVHGHRFARDRAGPLPRTESFAESLVVVLRSRATDRVDTIARLRGAYLGVRRLMKPLEPGGASILYFVVNPLAAAEQAMLFRDGWIALALTKPYRVTWISPLGERINGGPLPFDTLQVDAPEKRFAIARYWPDGPDLRPDEVPGWPTELPPFVEDALVALPNGNLAIRRTPHRRATATVYDLVDRRGELVGHLALGSDERLVGFGIRSAYVVLRDADGLEWLRRYDWR